MRKALIIFAVMTVVGIAATALQVWQHEKLLAKLALLSGNVPMAVEKAPASNTTVQAPDLATVLALPDRLDRMRALLALANDMNAEALHDLVQKLGKRTMNEDNQMTLSVLLARLVQLDPPGTLAWAKGLLNTEGRGPILETLFNSWSSADPVAALAALNQIDDVVLRQRLLETTLANMTNNDPQKALAFFLKLSTSQQDVRLVSPIFVNWAARDPVAAASAALNMPATANRFVALESALKGWAQKDPQAALNWAATLPSGSVRNSALSFAVANLARQNPQIAIAFVNSLPHAADRNDLSIALAAAWGQNDPEAALAWVEDFPSSPAHDAAIEGMLNLLSQTDPKLASSKLELISDPAVRNAALGEIAANWGMIDSAGALSWLSTLPSGGAQGEPVSQAARQLVYMWTLSDPASMAQFLTSQLSGVPYFQILSSSLVTTWESADPEGANAWVESLPAGPVKEWVVHIQAVEMANIKGWQLALSLPPGSNRNQSINLLIQRWPASDAAAAAPAFLETLADNPAQQASAVGSAVSAWLTQDEQAASQWVSSLPPSQARDAGATQIVTQALKNDPTTAFNWASSIGNAAQRNTQISRVINQWATKDPAAATAAVQTANVTDAQRTNLLNTIQRIVNRPANLTPGLLPNANGMTISPSN
jgi:hypothetical protein